MVLIDAPVFSFEADATLVPLIMRNLELNGRENGQVICSAVSDVEGAMVTMRPLMFVQ